MNDVVIRAEHLGKRYRIGGQQAGYKTLRESLMSALQAPRALARPRRAKSNRPSGRSMTFRLRSSEARPSASSGETAPARARS